MTVQISCLHARGISDLPMGNVPGLQHGPSIPEDRGYGGKQFRHVLVPPAFAQHHAMRMHLAVEQYPLPLYEKGTHEEERMGNVFQVAMRDEREHDAYDDEPFMEELAGLDMFDSIRAAPPDPKGEAVAVRGDNVPWDCGEHLALGHRHNDASQTLHSHHVPPFPPGTQTPPVVRSCCVV